MPPSCMHFVTSGKFTFLSLPLHHGIMTMSAQLYLSVCKCIAFTIIVHVNRTRLLHRPKVTTSSDHHYWAKGTGFGTGSTASNYNMEALTAKQKSEEKYVSLCFAILAEFLSLGAHSEAVKGEAGDGDAATVKGEGEDGVNGKSEAKEEEESEAVFVKGPPAELPDYCTLELTELLSDSCLLPAMASYLLNDSGELCEIKKKITVPRALPTAVDKLPYISVSPNFIFDIYPLPLQTN